MRLRLWVVATSALLVTGVAACTQLVLPAQSGTASTGTTSSGSSLTSLRALKTAVEVPTGQTQSLGLLVVGQDGLVPTGGLVWQSSNSGVVFVDPNSGEARAIAPGSAAVTVSAAGNPPVRAQIQVTVVDAPKVTLMKINPSVFSIGIGGQQQLTAEVQMPDGQTNGNVLWSSSDSTIATVNATTGQVTALKPGRVTIVAAYAVYPQYIALADVRVLAPGETPPPLPTPTPVVFGPTYSPTSPTPQGGGSPSPSAGFTGQWSKCGSLDHYLNDLTFASDSDGWAVDGYVANALIHTSDGCASWNTQLTSPTALEAVSFFGRSGWTGGQQGGLYQTADGGASWAAVTWPGKASMADVHSIAFRSSQDGLILANKGLWKTSDGGATWVQVTDKGGRGLVYGPNGPGFYLAGGDGGYLTFERYENGIVTAPTVDGKVYSFYPTTLSVSMIDSATGFASIGGDLVKTQDGGRTWLSVGSLKVQDGNLTDLEDFPAVAVTFFSSSVGVVLNGSGGARLTSDGGTTWAKASVQIENGNVADGNAWDGDVHLRPRLQLFDLAHGFLYVAPTHAGTTSGLYRLTP